MFIWRIVKNKYGMLVLGLIALGIGLAMLNQTTVKCGGEVMQQGDVCEHTRRGVTTGTNSFEEEQSNQRMGGMVFTGVGGALTLGGLGWIVVSLARRRPTESTESAESAEVSPTAAA